PILEYRYAGLASLFIAGITVGHCFGHRQSAFIQVFSTIIKLAILVAIALLGLLLGRGNWQYLSYGGTPTYAQLPALGIGLIYISYAYSGWNGASYLAGEVRNPRALLPRALISGCLVVIVLYLTLNLAFVYALDPVEMQTLPIEQVARVAELAASSLFGSYISVPLSTLLGLTLVASLSAYLLAGPRVLYAFAQDGFFFRAFGRLHPRWEVPVAATLLQGLLAMVFVWSGTFLQLLDYTSVGLAALSGLTVAAVFPLRRKLKGVDAYRMPWFPLPPLIYLGLICWIVTQALLQPDRRWSTILSLGTIALGLLPGLLKFGKVHR
ncbi:MAG TPA: amino acid permease, partial [Gemmatales bacterium]|nr:amino acid permease [Gemmatales bacterium]